MSELEREIPDTDFDQCLGILDFEASYLDRKVNVHLVYVKYEEDEICTHSFLQYIKRQILVKFVISCREVRKQYERRGAHIADKVLFEKALRKFSQSTAKGKIGELLLFMFIEVLLDAPKILSKISSLDDSNIHVKGADAVHAQYVDGDLILFLGESKLHKSYSNACGAAVTSLQDTLSDYQTEFDLIESSIDFRNHSEDLEEEIIAILDPYSGDAYIERIHFPCFIGFDSTICKNISSASEYEDKYRNSAQDRINTFYRNVGGKFASEKLHLILLPFESIDSFTDEFLEVLGIES